MSRALLVLNSPDIRAKAAKWVAVAPEGTRIEFKKPKRTLDQNSRFWAMLTDIAEQIEWHGVKLTPADWRLLFLAALKQEMRLVPNLDGNGFVNLGSSSSDLSKEEMSDAIELIAAFGAKSGVVFHDDRAEAA
jgi:sugar phosphate isomerase/epimerase